MKIAYLRKLPLQLSHFSWTLGLKIPQSTHLHLLFDHTESVDTLGGDRFAGVKPASSLLYGVGKALSFMPGKVLPSTY